MLSLSDANFVKEIGKVKGVALLDFHADWCGPCKIMEPILKELDEELKGKVTFGEIDVDQNSNTANQFGVMSIPTFVVLKDGKEVDRMLGAMSKDTLTEKLTRYLA